MMTAVVLCLDLRRVMNFLHSYRISQGEDSAVFKGYVSQVTSK